jgi:hypothetical protein
MNGRKKNPAAVALGKLGGPKGGRVRAERLTAERRSEISRLAARARWGEKAKGPERWPGVRVLRAADLNAELGVAGDCGCAEAVVRVLSELARDPAIRQWMGRAPWGQVRKAVLDALSGTGRSSG